MPPYSCEPIVCVRPFIAGGAMDEFMVWDRPGGAEPKIFEKAASR